MSDNGNGLIGINSHFVAEDNDTITRKHTQDIPQWHLDKLKEQRNASTKQREGEFMPVASIPTVVVEKWMREGFDIMSGKHSAAEIVKRLKAENLEAFLTTEKSV